MSSPNRAYSDLRRHLVRHRRRDLLLPLQEAREAVAAVAVVLEFVRRDAGARPARGAVSWLKAEALRRRAAFEHALYRVVEAIGDEPDGGDLVSSLLGDDDRLLADILLGEG
jgi:hypothetical protein